MTKLSDAQSIVLSSACQRDDDLAIGPTTLKAAAANKLVASLSAKGFVREIRAKAGVSVWREDDTGRFALKILRAAREARRFALIDG